MRVARIEIQKLQWISLFALFLDKCFSVQNLIQLSVKLVSIGFQLISFGPDVLIDVIECPHEYLIYLLSNLVCVFFNVAHLGHDLLQFLLDHVLLLSKRDILSYSFSACVGMRVFDSKHSFIHWLTASAFLHVSHYYAL